MNDKIEFIKPETVLEIKLGTKLIGTFQKMVMSLIKDKTSEELNKAHAEFETQVFTEEWIEYYYSALLLCNTFEKTAREQGCMDSMSIEEFTEKYQDK